MPVLLPTSFQDNSQLDTDLVSATSLLNARTVTDNIAFENQFEGIFPVNQPLGTNPIVGSVTNVASFRTRIAGEHLADRQYVYIEDSSTTTISHVTQFNSDGVSPFGRADVTDVKLGQTFSVANKQRVTRINCNLAKVASPSDSVRCGIQALDSNGDPDGSFIGSGTIGNASIGAGSENIDFSATITLEAGVVYSVVWERTGSLDSTNYYQLERDTGNPYSGGIMILFNGSTWADVSGTDAEFSIVQATVAGELFLASAAAASTSDGAIGIVIGATDVGNPCQVQVQGIPNLMNRNNGSDLTEAVVYFLSDTRGQIATSAGVVTNKVGFAMSTQELLIVQT